MTPDLGAQWHQLCERHAIDPTTATTLFDGIRTAYTEPTRRYHTLDHIGATLTAADVLAPSGSAPDAVRFALWYHDIVYDPRRVDNEERSARRCGNELADAGVTAPVIDVVTALVRATAAHSADPTLVGAALVNDADLSILAAAPDDYDRYAIDVRAEFGFVPDDAWRTGRARILDDFLARPRLFCAAPEQWERQARANIRRELDGLRAANGDAG